MSAKMPTLSEQRPRATVRPGATHQAPARQPTSAEFATSLHLAVQSPGALTPAAIQHLQGTIGNAAISRLLAQTGCTATTPRPAPIQAKLLIGPTGDKYEQEADRVAAQVVNQIHAPAVAQAASGVSVQRQNEPEEELQVQTKGIKINDDSWLKSEAGMMSRNAAKISSVTPLSLPIIPPLYRAASRIAVQRVGVDAIISDADTGGTGIPDGGTMSGFGLPVKSGTNFTSDIKWGPPTAKVRSYEPEGTWMEASILGPDHPLGSAPAGATMMNAQKQTSDTGTKWIGGHLLNDNLGGSGTDPRNIAAIPEGVNKLHSSQVEELIKRVVNKQGGWVY